MDMTLADPGARADRCDIAPSRFARIDREGYFTIDADWIVPALCRVVHVEGPILEPCAGRGHMVVELRALGFEVEAADLHVHEDPLVPDIATGADVFDLDSLSGYRSVVTNLPYEHQVAILAHILPIAARDGCSVAALARSEWRSAQGRRALVHDNSRFAGEVVLTKRPIWVRPVIKSPRHWFSWYVWSPVPRASDRDPFLRFAGLREWSRNDGQDGQNGQDGVPTRLLATQTTLPSRCKAGSSLAISARGGLKPTAITRKKEIEHGM